jgi:hypothetical protein
MPLTESGNVEASISRQLVFFTVIPLTVAIIEQSFLSDQCFISKKKLRENCTQVQEISETNFGSNSSFERIER